MEILLENGSERLIKWMCSKRKLTLCCKSDNVLFRSQRQDFYYIFFELHDILNGLLR